MQREIYFQNSKWYYVLKYVSMPGVFVAMIKFLIHCVFFNGEAGEYIWLRIIIGVLIIVFFGAILWPLVKMTSVVFYSNKITIGMISQKHISFENIISLQKSVLLPEIIPNLYVLKFKDEKKTKSFYIIPNGSYDELIHLIRKKHVELKSIEEKQ